VANSTGVKVLESDADLSPASNSAVVSPYLWCLIKQRENFTFALKKYDVTARTGFNGLRTVSKCPTLILR
jgi:hypothetical protein